MPASLSRHRARSVSPLRFLVLACLAILIAALSTLAAHLLHLLIAVLTQFAFYGRLSTEWASASGHTRGAWVILIPAAGGAVIALMARFGARAVIGHGIPEVMQQVLSNRSRIAPRVALLKPLSSVISIGSGGPYGAEGPVIATGSALGSLVGQALTMTATERKTMLAAGAAAAMTAIFGSPVAATLLAVELLLFEFRPRSFILVAISAAAAQAMRFAWGEPAALFTLAGPSTWSAPASTLPVFVAIGLFAGVLAVLANSAVHTTEHLFAKLPVSWMWHPIIGGLIVGVIGWIEPRVFGASYDVIGALLAGDLTLSVVALVCGLKLVAWVLSLGSGTSGGTLAPMLVAGGGMGVLVGALFSWLPAAPVSPQLAALVGMVAFFAGGSRALFASVILGVEITQQAAVLWPAASGATVAMATAFLLSGRSIMTSPVEQQGIRVPMDLDVDAFARVTVGQVMEKAPRTIVADMRVEELAGRIAAGDPEVCHHHALLVTETDGSLIGIVTRRDILNAAEQAGTVSRVRDLMSCPLICSWPDESLDEALDRMHAHDIGRLPVVARNDPRQLVGYLGRGAVLSARRICSEDSMSAESGWLDRRSGR